MAGVFSVSLHSEKDHIEQAVDILNEEWPRSRTARKHMLEKSNDKFPYSLILLEKEDDGGMIVIGHSRLCQVHGQADACFVESVVVCKSKRGKGFGRILMKESEKHATRLGIKTIYLTTHDKQDFYGHIGYTYCEPVLSFGGASKLIPESLADSLFGKLTVTSSEINIKSTPNDQNKQTRDETAKVSSQEQNNTEDSSSENPVLSNKSVGRENKSVSSASADLNQSTEGHKDCTKPPTSGPPLPPPPPPPVPPPVLKTQPKDIKITGEKVQRFGGKVYWMKKSIL